MEAAGDKKGKRMPEMIFSKKFAAGEEIFRIGDRGRNAYIIERGKIEVSVSRDDENVVVAERFGRIGASTYFHRRVPHLTALRVLRLGAWSAVMPVHHKGRATTSEEPARPPEGSHFAATGGL